MPQYSKAGIKAIREAEICSKKQQENLENNLLSELYYFMIESERRKNDSAAELEAEMKLEEAVENGSPANTILDLATDLCNAGRETAFKMGFRLATKLLKEGLC